MSEWQTSMVLTQAQSQQLQGTILGPGIRVWDGYRKLFVMGDGSTLGGIIIGPITINVGNAIADDSIIQGREYLSTWYKFLQLGSDINAQISGDSTAEGDQAGGNTVDVLLTEYLRSRGLSGRLEVLNRGHSGGGAGQWQTTWLPADLALNPNLYVIRGWGLNGPDTAKSDLVNANEQLAQIEAGLVKIRAAKSYIDLPVLISGTSSVYDDPHARTQNYLKLLDDGVRLLARKYQCAYISLRSYMQDANVPASAANDAGWIADAYNPGSGLYVHPTSVGNLMLTALIHEALWPATMTQVSQFQTRNVLDPVGRVPAASLTPAYRAGLSYLTAVTSDGYPISGVLESAKHASGFTRQYLWSSDDTTGTNIAQRFMSPISGNGGWRFPISSAKPNTDAANITISPPFTAWSVAAPKYRVRDDTIKLSGGLRYNSGAFADGTSIGQISVANAPSVTRIADFSYQRNGQYVGNGCIAMGPSGTLLIYGVTGLVAGDLLFLDGVSFDV